MGCSQSKIDNISAVNQCKQRTAFMKQSVSAYTAFVSAHNAYVVALKNTATALSDYARSELQSPDDHPPTLLPPSLEDNDIFAWDLSGPGDGGGEGQLPSSVAGDTENVNLMKVFGELGDGFVETSNSAYKALQVHANNQGHFEHSIVKGGKVDFSSKEKETHATLLDKMLAWEKKLYDQVKDGEKIKHKYQKKMASLDNKSKRGVSRDRLKQREATVNHLHAAHAVEMQSIDSTVTEINRLRDQHLYPTLVQIVEKMGEMWTDMREQHEQQSAIVQRLINSIKISQLPTDNNPKNMEQIHLKLTIWCSEFENLILHQKEYFKSLNNWLKLKPISTHNIMKPQNPKLTSLLRAWNDEIEKLPETRAKAAIKSLAAAIVHNRSHAMKLQENCDGIRREIEKKTREFEMDDVDAEQQVVVEAEEVCRRYGVQVMEKSVVEMMAALTEVFMAMAEYAGGCLTMFGNLKSH